VARTRWLDRPGAAQPLVEVDHAWRIRTASKALRDASDLLGRSYLRLSASVWPALAALTSDRTHAWCRAVAVGVTTAEAGLDAAQTARLVAFEDVQTVIAAALKLRPFDPAVAVAWSVALAGDAEAMVERVCGATELDHIPAYAAPQIEHWAELHTRTERRLFRA
jgi:urease accessory protein